MILCPNLKNPEVARVFDELKQATSEQAAYHIWSLNNGNAIDKAPNGAESKLFQALLEHYNGDRTKAIQAKAKIYGNSFLTWFGDWINDTENASKVVDENGEPLMVWHGGYLTENNSMPDPTYEEETYDWNGYLIPGRERNPGIWFSTDKEYTTNFSSKQYPCFLNIRNPYRTDDLSSRVAADIRESEDYIISEEDLQAQGGKSDGLIGHDAKTWGGLTIEELKNDPRFGGPIPKLSKGIEFAIYDPNQAKSIDNEGPTPWEGTYSRENDDIYLSIDNTNARGNRDISITNQLISHLRSIGIKVRNRRDMIKYLREHGLSGLQKFIGRKARTKFEQQLLRARPDMTNAEIKATLDFLHSLEDNKENTAYIKTAVRWIANCSITLPQDNTKARQAFDLARKKHIDLQKYDTLGDLIASDEMKPKEKEKAKFDPDKAKTFSNKHTVTTEGGRIFIVYDVENTEEGQREVCKALAAHYKMSPWCLSTFTATGEPTQSAKHYWDVYSGIQRKIAYENGKPVAFSSSQPTIIQKFDYDSIDGYQLPVGLWLPNILNQNQSNGVGRRQFDPDTLDYLFDNGYVERNPSYDQTVIDDAYKLTKKGERAVERIHVKPKLEDRESWWDMEDRYPQESLTDNIQSTNIVIQDGVREDTENFVMDEVEFIEPEPPDPEELFMMDIENEILNILNNELFSILADRNLIPVNENQTWYRNALMNRYYDRTNFDQRAHELINNESLSGREIAQIILSENNVFDNIRSTIEQEIQNLPQPIAAIPVNPDVHGLYTQLDRYSDEYLRDLINTSQNQVEIQTAGSILENRQSAREAGDYLPFFITPSGEIYGFVTPDGNIYLDETVISPEHPIHEYTHMWDRTVAEKNSDLWKKGVELMKQISLWEQIENNPNYGQRWKAMSDMTADRFEFLVASEVHSRLVGENGSKLLDRIAKQKGKKSIVAKLKQWILDFWKDLKSTFSDWSESDIQKLTLDDFNHMTVRDFADGVNFNNTSSNEFKSQLQKLGAELMERCKG